MRLRSIAWVIGFVVVGCKNQQPQSQPAETGKDIKPEPAKKAAPTPAQGSVGITKEDEGGEDKPCGNCTLDLNKMVVAIQMDVDNKERPYLPLECAIIQTYKLDGEKLKFYDHMVLTDPPTDGFAYSATPKEYKVNFRTKDKKDKNLVVSASIYFIGTKFKKDGYDDDETRPLDFKKKTYDASGFDRFINGDVDETTPNSAIHPDWEGKKCADF